MKFIFVIPVIKLLYNCRILTNRYLHNNNQILSCILVQLHVKACLLVLWPVDTSVSWELKLAGNGFFDALYTFHRRNFPKKLFLTVAKIFKIDRNMPRYEPLCSRFRVGWKCMQKIVTMSLCGFSYHCRYNWLNNIKFVVSL